MSGLRDMSMGRKLTAIILSITAVTLLLACAVMVSYDVVTNQRAIAIDASILADMVAANSTAALTFNDVPAAHEVLQSLRSQAHITAAGLYAQDGTLFAVYVRSGRDSDFSAPLFRAGGSFFEGGHLLVFRPVRVGGRLDRHGLSGIGFIRDECRTADLPAGDWAGTIGFFVGRLVAGGSTARVGFRAHPRTGADRQKSFAGAELCPALSGHESR